MCIILNEPSRLTIVVKQVSGTWRGKEIEIGNFEKTIKINIEESDNCIESEEIKNAFKRLTEILLKDSSNDQAK